MANLSDKDKRTLRMGGVAVGVYLALFTLLQVVKWAGAKRAGYDKILAEAQTLRLQIQPYETKSLRLRRLMESFNLDPALLRPTTGVADANAAIQKAAMSGGIQLGLGSEQFPPQGVRKIEDLCGKIHGPGDFQAIETAPCTRCKSPLINQSVRFSVVANF